MKRTGTRTWILLGAVASMLTGGCYEEHTPPQTAAPPPPPPAQPPPGGPAYGTAQPGLSGATNAAQNTVDRVNQRQLELEKALEDQ